MIKTKFLALALLLIGTAVSPVSAKEYKAALFGVKSDGTTNNTRSIQKAVDFISENGGGELAFYVGRYLTGTIHLKSNVTIVIKEGAALMASTSPYDYDYVNGTAALIVADTAKNIGITGKGLIDGQGTLVTGHYNTQAAQGNLAAGAGGAVGHDLFGIHPVANRAAGPLVDAGAGIGTGELGQVQGLGLAVVITQGDGIGGDGGNHAGLLGLQADFGIHSGLVLHTGADNRTLGLEQRHCLSLHVRAHQCTVCVIVFQERNHRSCNRNDHLRGNIHKVNAILFDFQNLFPITSRNLAICKVSVFGQRFVCLSSTSAVI